MYPNKTIKAGMTVQLPKQTIIRKLNDKKTAIALANSIIVLVLTSEPKFKFWVDNEIYEIYQPIQAALKSNDFKIISGGVNGQL